MKKLKVVAWAFFGLGLLFKTLHYKGANEFLLLGVILLFVFAFWFLIKNIRNNYLQVLLNFCFAFWSLYLLFRFLYWSVGPSILGLGLLFIIPFIITLIYFISLIDSKKKIKWPQIALLIYFSFSVFIGYTHSDAIFYFFNLNEVVHSQHRKIDFYSWDKYSWFLFKNNKPEEAIVANENAVKAAQNVLSSGSDYNAENYLPVIQKHGENIRDNNWTQYP
jgi:hypothetical protein